MKRGLFLHTHPNIILTIDMQSIAEKRRGLLMDKTLIKEKGKVAKLKNPVMVTGLPGIGLIGQVAAKYLIKKLKGEKIAEIYSPHFPH